MRALFVLLGLVASPWLTAASAQTSPPPLFNLNGIWELHEYGARLASAEPLVEINHAGNTVTAYFIRASECFNGQARVAAFIGQLGAVQPTTPPSLLMTAHTMFVCSNDPALVNKCGGTVHAIYQTTVTYATAEPDFIQGSRVTQGVNGCTPDASQNGTARFWLRRLTPCEYEERVLRDAEDAMLELQRSMNTARPVFQAAIDAATRRFGPHYRDQPITTLDYAAGLVSLDVSTLHAEATFSAMPDVFTSSEWINARRLAGELLLASPPLAEAQGMINEMRRIESLAASAQRVLADFRLAQQALQKCRGVAR